MKDDIRFLEHFQDQIYNIPFRIQKHSSGYRYVRMDSFDNILLIQFLTFLIMTKNPSKDLSECMLIEITRDILASYGIPKDSYKKLLDMLLDKGIIYRYNRSIYTLNPYHFHVIPSILLEGFFNRMYRIKQTKNITLCMQTLKR